jgi:inner membrane protein
VGDSFVQPVDFYLLSERSVKYGLLIVALLFLIYFLFEVLAGIVLHPLQYLMIGAALVLFFLSLVSFAEVIGFAAAYALSGALVVALISLYTAAILQRWLWAVLLAAAVSALYGLLYVILNQEEAALLSGTLVLFAALAATMYATRRIDWFNIRSTSKA